MSIVAKTRGAQRSSGRRIAITTDGQTAAGDILRFLVKSWSTCGPRKSLQPARQGSCLLVK
jgi:hypothetical protein